MNIVTVSRIEYPPPPHGWQGMGFYYEITPIATYETDKEHLDEIEKEAAYLHQDANRINIADAATPESWWAAGCLAFRPWT
jgi:hypothetical protein